MDWSIRLYRQGQQEWCEGKRMTFSRNISNDVLCFLFLEGPPAGLCAWWTGSPIMSFILIFSRKVFREPNPTRFKSTKSDAKIISTDFISGPITHIKYSYTAVKNICRCSFWLWVWRKKIWLWVWRKTFHLKGHVFAKSESGSDAR